MGQVEQLNTASDDEREFIWHTGHDLRGYAFALEAILEDLPQMNEDGPVADAIGMMLKRVNDVADSLLERSSAASTKPLKERV